MIIQNIRKQIEVSKKGNPYARVLLQFEEYKDGKGNMRWVTGFGNKLTWAWKIGDDVQPTITEEGKYLNFTFGDSDENRLDVYRLPATIGFVMELLKGKKPQAQQTERPSEASDDGDIDPDDIPF